MEDKEIVELYFTRSEKAIGETDNKYRKYCYSIANNIMGNSEDANECVNDTLYQAWHRIPPEKPKILSAFLGKITHDIAIDRWRKATADKRGGGQISLVLDELAECIPADHSVEHSVEYKELEKAIHAFIRGLKQPEKNIFVCRYWYCDEPSVIAKRLGMTSGAVRSRLHRSRKKLYTYLKECDYID